ncbi:redoxin domain-containing protein [bacterium]|nr:redoxin domain-containing protein [bacterium]
MNSSSVLSLVLVTLWLPFSPATAVAAVRQEPPEISPANWIGMKAPEFRLTGTDGKTHSLDALVSRGPLIVVWFPKAYTGNVERLLKSADQAASTLKNHGIGLVAASCDKPKYLTPFALEKGLNLTILADPTRTTAIQWGAVGTGREIPHRWAYFIGRDGRIAAIRTDLDAESTGEKLISKARELGWIE